MTTTPNTEHPDYDIASFTREAEERRLVGAFADFLKLADISGTNQSQSTRTVLKAEDVIDIPSSVEVMKDDNLSTHEHGSPMTFLVHRDEHNDIRSIEVLCSCGKRAVLALEYEDSPDPTED